MTFPDAEAMVRQHLLSVAYREGARVFTRVPNQRPDNFLRVWRSGGAAMNRVVDMPLITVESWGEDDTIAASNANLARERLLSHAVDMPLVRRVSERVGPYYDPDPVSGAARYSFTAELVVRDPLTP